MILKVDNAKLYKMKKRSIGARIGLLGRCL